MQNGKTLLILRTVLKLIRYPNTFGFVTTVSKNCILALSMGQPGNTILFEIISFSFFLMLTKTRTSVFQ